MLRAPRALQRVHLAGLRQQRPQPGDLHHVQHRVQTGLHQDPQLLRKLHRAGKCVWGWGDWNGSNWSWKVYFFLIVEQAVRRFFRRKKKMLSYARNAIKREFFFFFKVIFVQYNSSNETYFHMNWVLTAAQGVWICVVNAPPLFQYSSNTGLCMYLQYNQMLSKCGAYQQN